MRKPVIALSTHIFGNRPLELEDFVMLKDFGVSAIELWYMAPQLEITELSEISKIKGWLEKNHIRCVSVHAPFYADFSKPSFRWLSLSSTKSKNREEAVGLTNQTISAARELAADMVVIHGIGEKDEPLDFVEKLFADSISKLVETAERYRINLAMENIATDYSRARMLSNFIRRFGNESIGICLDIGHAFMDDNPATALDEAKEYLFEVHIDDNMGFEDDHLIPHEGKIDWEPVWQRLKDSAQLKVATFEIMPPDISGEDRRIEVKKRFEKVVIALQEAAEKIL